MVKGKPQPRQRCRNSKRYRGKRLPRCNGGYGCWACWERWLWVNTDAIR
jgi:hypothetical protein